MARPALISAKALKRGNYFHSTGLLDLLRVNFCQFPRKKSPGEPDGCPGDF
jgi:hypothetical protein